MAKQGSMDMFLKRKNTNVESEIETDYSNSSDSASADINESEVTVTLEDKLLDLAADEGLKMVFNTMPSIASFWIHVKAE